jgi:CBS domain containing-hemolysin-like protein
MTQNKNTLSKSEEDPSSSDVAPSPSQLNGNNTYEIYEYENTLDENGKDQDEFSSISKSMQDLDNPTQTSETHTSDTSEGGFLSRITSFLRPKNDASLRETIEEYIENGGNVEEDALLSVHEKALLSNVLELHNIVASDVMIPRADIIGVRHDISQKELFALLAEKQYSRYPVFKNTLDNIVGSIHIKDILTNIACDEAFDMNTLIRDIPIISPSMHVLDLLTQMRLTRKHVALVVDEFGGIDGLITIGDLIEAIVGEIDDEHNLEVQPEMTLQVDGSILADARYDVDEFEDIYGEILSEEEREGNDTLGGLTFYLAGRVPARGEVLKHSSGMIFEIVDADPRRVKLLKISNIPNQSRITL